MRVNRFWGASAAVVLGTSPLSAQGVVQQIGPVTSGHVAAWWQNGQIYDGGSVPLPNTTNIWTAKQTFGPGTTNSAPISILPGVAPTFPANGDIWTTGTGIFTRLNGATQALSPVVVPYTCLNTSADQTNIDAIVTTLKAASGGMVQLSAGTCLFDGIVTTAGGNAPRVNFTGTGEYGATNVQATGRANYVFTVGDFSSVTNMRILGASANLGGIQIAPSSTAYVHNVEIDGFSGSTAVAMDVDGTTGSGALRTLVDHVYLYNNSHLLRLRGTTNDFQFNYSSLANATSTDAGALIDAESGTSLDAYFNNFDFASTIATSPIRCSTSGQMTFNQGGLEDMAIGTSPGATVANAKVFDITPPCVAKVSNATFTGFHTAAYTYTGTPTFFSGGTDTTDIDLDHITMIQTDNPGAVNIAFVGQRGAVTRLSERNNRIRCIGCTSHAQNQAIFTNGINADFGSKFGDIINNISVSNYDNTSWGFKQQLGTLSAVATSTTTAAVLDTITLPTKSFWKSRSLKWSGCGKTTGTAGTHTVDFSFNAGGATTYNVSTGSIAQDWCSTVTVFFNNFTTESVNVSGVTGTTPINSVTAASKATDVNAPVFSILGTAGGGDSVTLTSSYWELQ